MTNTAAAAPRWWVPGDWNGFFGLFTNVVLNVIVLTGLCLHVVNLPANIAVSADSGNVSAVVTYNVTATGRTEKEALARVMEALTQHFKTSPRT